MKNFAVILVSASLSLAPTSALLAAAPEMILFNGKIFTSNIAIPHARALAVAGDRILAVGSDRAVRALADAHTRQIDLHGRTVIPGINDAHNHLGISPANSMRLEFPGGDASWSQVAPILSAADQKAGEGAILLGAIGPALFKDVSVTREALDRVAPKHPVVLTTFTGHACILNSAALRRFGIGEDHTDFPGTRFERSADGKLTGVLREYARMIVRRKLAEQTSDGDGVRELRGDLNDALKFGITTIQDMANVIPPERIVRLLKDAQAPLRVRVMRMPMTTTVGRDLSEGRGMPMLPSALISVSGTKWMLDGTPLEGTYAPRDDRQSPMALFEHLGLTFSEAEVRRMLEETLQGNDQALFHVSGYPAARVLLTAMMDTGGPGVWVRRRLRIEHGDGLLPDLLPEVKQLGVVVVQNPQHFVGLPPPLFKEAEELTLQPLKSLLKAGIPVALGSDDEMNPFLDVMLASSHPNRPSQAITREQAVIAYTLTSAFAEFAEKDLGSIEPGKIADLAVLSQDIFTIPAQRLPATRSVMTIVGAKIVYDAKVLN